MENNLIETLIPIAFIVGIGVILTILIIAIFQAFKPLDRPQRTDYTRSSKPPHKVAGYENVLDLYERSHIRLPVEVIEELDYLQPESDEEAFQYIENQRHHWKLENSKKVFKLK